MKKYILSDEVILSLKHTLQKEMTAGLEGSKKSDSLPMKITYITDRYKETGM